MGNLAISSQSERCQLKMLRQAFHPREIGKPRHLGLESEFDGSARAVPLFADEMVNQPAVMREASMLRPCGRVESVEWQLTMSISS